MKRCSNRKQRSYFHILQSKILARISATETAQPLARKEYNTAILVKIVSECMLPPDEIQRRMINSEHWIRPGNGHHSRIIYNGPGEGRQIFSYA